MSKESILITRRMTESQVQGIASSLILRKRWKFWSVLFIGTFGWVFAIMTILKPSIITDLVAIVPMILAVIVFVRNANKVGTRVWNSIKDKEQPVKVDW